MSSVIGLPVSVQTRLVRHAHLIGLDPNLILSRYAAERFLYRLSRSHHGDRFVLKGAMLMLVWLGETIRPTRDVDLLGFGALSEDSLAAIIREVCNTDVEPDGMEYPADFVRLAPIRPEDSYGGLRATVQARLGNARILVQVDVGIGDVVEPAPEWLDYPALLDAPAPRLRAYRPETAIAEKLHAMVVLGQANSRMRDFFDVYVLSERFAFDANVLSDAVRATFERRGTLIPTTPPLALTHEFAAAPGKQVQWDGYLRKNHLSKEPRDLNKIVVRLAIFLAPIIAAARNGDSPNEAWSPGGPWETK